MDNAKRNVFRSDGDFLAVGKKFLILNQLSNA